jgi:hypothetical protein
VRDTLDVQTEVARSRLFYPYVKRVVFGEIVNAVESTPQEDKELKYDFKTRFPNEGWEHLGLRTTTYPNPKRLDLRHAPFGDDYSNTEATRYILGLNKYLIYGHERPGTPPGYHPELEHLYRLDGWSLWRSRFKGATVQDFLANKDYWERSHGDSYDFIKIPTDRSFKVSTKNGAVVIVPDLDLYVCSGGIWTGLFPQGRLFE